MNKEEFNSTWLVNLILADCKPNALAMHVARTLGVLPQRYNEIALAINTMIESTSGPSEFWVIMDRERKALYLNDVESVVFGALICSVLIQIDNSVSYGKKLAKINKVDYDDLVKRVLGENGICLGTMDGVKGQ